MNYIVKKFKSGFSQFVEALTGTESIMIKRDGTSSPFWISLTNLLAGRTTTAEVNTLILAAITESTVKEFAKVTLQSITTAPDPRQLSIGLKYYDATTKKIYTITQPDGEFMWDNPENPITGVVYIFRGSYLYWNGYEIAPPVIGGVTTVYQSFSFDVNDPSTNTNNIMVEGGSKWVKDGIIYTWFGVWVEI